MSSPANPLDKYQNFSYSHVLVAYKYSNDASTASFQENDISQVKEGMPINGDCGNGIVVVNEKLQASKFEIPSAQWEYSFFNPKQLATTSNVGIIQVVEKVGMSFMDFLNNQVVPQLGGTSISHIGFALKTFFEASNFDGTSEVFSGNQYVFHSLQVVNAVGNDSSRPKSHTFMTVGASHSLSQLPSYNNLYQFTLTHKDGNLHKEVPKPEPESCNLIMPRGVEDAMKNSPRDERLNKSKPMKTLKDIFDALEVELNEQKYAHKAQVQQWMRYVRDDHVDKIKVPPKQKKPPYGDYLPIKFHVNLEKEYESYMVNNRNLPFEQPEQSQDVDGIRSFQIEPSSSLVDLAVQLCCLSKQMGDDALKEKPEIPKVSISVVRECDDHYHVYLKVKKIFNPENSQTKDSGPGKGGVNPITFFMQNIDENDIDIISMDSKLSYSNGETIMEEHKDEPDSKTIYGNREQLTGEKEQDRDYFKTMFSGLRVMKGTCKADGLEDGVRGSALLNLSTLQFSTFDVTIHGNPYLLFDVNRKPHEVGADSDGEVHYYKKPEVYPIYAKITFYENSYDITGVSPPEETMIPQVHYHTNHYHVTKVKNVFGSFEGDATTRDFHQVLEMRRTDNSL